MSDGNVRETNCNNILVESDCLAAVKLGTGASTPGSQHLSSCCWAMTKIYAFFG